MKIMLSFTHCHVIPNLYDIFSCIEHKRSNFIYTALFHSNSTEITMSKMEKSPDGVKILIHQITHDPQGSMCVCLPAVSVMASFNRSVLSFYF